MREPALPPWFDDAQHDAVGEALLRHAHRTPLGHLLDVATDRLPPDRIPAGCDYVHVARSEDLGGTDGEVADAVALRFVLAGATVATRSTVLAAAWARLGSGGMLLFVDDFNPEPSTEFDWSADHLIRSILDVSGGAATLDDVIVLRDGEEDEERYACIAVTRL